MLHCKYAYASQALSKSSFIVLLFTLYIEKFSFYIFFYLSVYLDSSIYLVKLRLS